MHHIWLCLIVASVLSSATPAEAQAKVRAYTTKGSDDGPLAVVIRKHGMGGDGATYVWDDGRIVYHTGSLPRVRETWKVTVSALDPVRRAIARMRPARHRGSCEYGVLDSPDIEIQFRRGRKMIHLPCYVEQNANAAVRALDELLKAASEHPWWLERPKLRVRSKTAGGVSYKSRGPSVRFIPSRTPHCRQSHPASVIFSEREDGRIVVAMDGCNEDGPTPDAISVVREDLHVILRISKTGAAVARDDCMWRSEIDLGRLEGLTHVTIDLGEPWD